MIIDRALQWKMGANGRRAVLEKYNWEKESEKLLALYKGRASEVGLEIREEILEGG